MLSKKSGMHLSPSPHQPRDTGSRGQVGVKQKNRAEVISAGRRGAEETQESSRTYYSKFLCQCFILQIKVP